MISKKELSFNSYSFIGDAIYTLRVRTHLVMSGYQKPKDLQRLSLNYVSAKSQFEIFNYLNDELNMFSKEELIWYKRGRNHIGHIPKNGNLLTYQVASGLEAVVGYWYLNDKDRMEEVFEAIFKWRKL